MPGAMPTIAVGMLEKLGMPRHGIPQIVISFQ
jgi:hypothetical protein